MAIATGTSLLNSIIGATGVEMGVAVKLVSAARLQQMINAGVDGGLSVALVLSAASSEIRKAVPVLTNLATTINNAKADIEGSLYTSTDIDTGTLQDPVVFDAGTGSFDFMDDAMILTNVVINNFTSDDHITISNAQETDYFFSNDGADMNISFNNNGTVNMISLIGVVDSSIPLNGQEMFEEAIGFNAFA